MARRGGKGGKTSLWMANTYWLRCEIREGPRQARRLSEVREVAQGLCEEDGHVSVEIAPGRVFCDIYYWGPSRSLFYLATALYMATGEQFWHQSTFPSVPQVREAPQT